MTLIWAEGFTGDKALAVLWQRYMQADARTKDQTLSPAARGNALVRSEQAKRIYDDTVAEAEAALVQAAAAGQARTHVLAIGVGQYANASIPALTTSVHGAWTFADWMLNRFQQPDCPLGSVELLITPTTGMGDWQPPSPTAARLGLTKAAARRGIPVEQAAFANIEQAFNRWLKRASIHAKNAAFFYFAGHGLWKDVPLLLPTDAQLPTSTQSFANLIDIHQTLQNMFNTQPRVQCFFIDACQEIPLALLQNVAANPGKPLHQPTNAPIIQERDANGYYGSRAGQRAYGPADQAPFFTQELLACLERRGAARKKADTWRVTTGSLRTALDAASRYRAEKEQQNIGFSVLPGQSSFEAELCQIKDNLEVFVTIECLPALHMQQAKLYVDSNGKRYSRAAIRPTEWYIAVAHSRCLAGAEFDAAASLNTTLDFEPIPPLDAVTLRLGS